MKGCSLGRMSWMRDFLVLLVHLLVTAARLVTPGGLRSVVVESVLLPWNGVPLLRPVYCERGHRRLAGKTCESKCQTCIWGCHAGGDHHRSLEPRSRAVPNGSLLLLDRYHVPSISPVPHAKFLVVMG